MKVKVEITEEILDAIGHVCNWYQGREVDLCEMVEEWTVSIKKQSAILFELKRIHEEYDKKQKEWLSQFKEGDLYKPKEWKCKKKGQKYCEYEPYNDPACDGCVHCNQPLERL